MIALRSLSALAAVWLGAAAGASALTIELDYTYDTGNFFGGVNLSRRSILNSAATALSSRLTDDLLSITPGGSNSWHAIITDPSTGQDLSILNPNIAADTVRVYVGARALSGGTLGIGGPGGFDASGNQAWFDRLEARGESGALNATPTDFGPWGGSLTFSSTANWYFDSDPSTVESFGTKSDFYSVALHELGHLLGIGTADSWMSLIVSGSFRGARAMAVKGGAVPVTSDGGHWAEGVSGHLEGTLTTQEAALDPTLTTGTRKYFTDLDFAGLDDLGWQVAPIPEPGTALLLLAVGSFSLGKRRRSAKRQLPR